MKKHLHYVLSFLFLAYSLQGQVVGWNQPTSGTPTVFNIGTSTAGVEVGRSICIDAAGNTYVYGMFTGTADFDPSGAVTTATANGTSSDLFIAKYNAAGAFQWVARGGVANSGDNGAGNFGSIKTDGTNVYVVGNLAVSANSATFTPVGSCSTCTVPSNAATTRGFVGKLDAATGTWQWINTFGGTTTQNGGQGLCLDPIGNIYVSGQCSGTFTLGALPQISVADPEVFFGKLSPGGVWQWATTAGGAGGDGAGQSGSGITFNANLNRLAASGSYNSTTPAAFGSFSLAATSGNTNDIFLTEISPTTGAFLSAFGFGGTGTADECGGIVYDPNTNDIFLAGQMSGNLSLPGFGTLTQASATTNDIFVGRFTPNATPTNGVFSWAKSFGLSGSDRAYDIATNANGNIYIAGWFSGAGTINFAASTATQVTSTGTDSEIFVAALTVGGTGVWAVQAEDTAATGIEQARGVCAAQNTSGTVYATGQFNVGTVSWTPSSNGNVISLTSAGTSDVWVGKIYGGLPLTATQSQVNLTCNGVCNGSATVVASGGTSPYTYSWAPSGGTGATASSLCAGTYTCTITDAASSSITKTFTVTQPPVISVTAASQTNISCFGGSNGAASINTPTGGTGGYTYNWTPGNPTGDGTVSVSGLIAGTWTCTVTDGNSCTRTQTFTVTQPPALVVSASTQTNVACFGGSNGAARINTPTGGAGGYTYNWTPGNPTGDGTVSVTGLSAGSWTCTVTDANSCTATQTFTVTQPPALSVTASSQTNVACFGGATGAATINTPTGGAGGYTYNWTPGNPTGDGTVSVTGLSVGTWTCTVTDANSCTATTTFNVTQPPALSVTASSQTNISCNGGSNGAASINTPTGGAGSYTYNWTPGNPTGDGTVSVTGLSVGTWTCTVTDANSCTATQTFTVTQPPAISVTPASQTNVACNGGSNGAASINTPTGGAGGYTYNWTPGNPTGDGTTSVTGLSAGSWTCTVTDANSCTATRTFTVTQPAALDNTVSLALGILTANLSGATYQWYQCPSTLLSGAINQSYTPTVVGDYKVDVTLAGCTVTSACTTVSTLGINDFVLVSKFNLYPNPNSGIININSDTNGDILIVNQLGQVVKAFSIEANVINKINVEELSEGTYFVKGTNGTNINTQKLVIKK